MRSYIIFHLRFPSITPDPASYRKLPLDRAQLYYHYLNESILQASKLTQESEV